MMERRHTEERGAFAENMITKVGQPFLDDPCRWPLDVLAAGGVVAGRPSERPYA